MENSEQSVKQDRLSQPATPATTQGVLKRLKLLKNNRPAPIKYQKLRGFMLLNSGEVAAGKLGLSGLSECFLQTAAAFPASRKARCIRVQHLRSCGGIVAGFMGISGTADSPMQPLATLFNRHLMLNQIKLPL